MKIVLGFYVASLLLFYSGCGDLASLLEEKSGQKTHVHMTGNLADSPELHWLSGSWGPSGRARQDDVEFAINPSGTQLTMRQVHKLYPKDRSLSPKDCYVQSTSSAFQMKKVGQGERTEFTIVSEPSHVEMIIHDDPAFNSPECRNLVNELQTRIRDWKGSGQGQAWKETISFRKTGNSIFMNDIDRLYVKRGY